MVRAWYMDADTTNLQLEHHREPPKPISIDTLFDKSGVEYFKISAFRWDLDRVLCAVKKYRGFTYQDLKTYRNDADFNHQNELIYKEHLHTDEEIRLVIAGTAYYDVRLHDVRLHHDNDWIRIEVTKGDMVIIPRGCYHRLTPGPLNFIQMVRYFVGEPNWAAHESPEGDKLSCREEYIKRVIFSFKKKIL